MPRCAAADCRSISSCGCARDRPGLRDITDAVHREEAAAAIQIGHCGNMTHWTTAGQMPIGASSGFNLYAYTTVRGMKKREIEQVARDFGTAVRTAHDAGFDSVEVHAGHGYLISQFLSPYTNHRRDEYGGSLENRMRFMRMCLGRPSRRPAHAAWPSP